ncbi:acetylglutamate kinase [Sediminitomix flava]|uniref:Acetylglutamate kinase n=1 Tax=Sediminitomix flava TaxID=379075 RepID=A0A315Z813_SEDFL|nr:acetylglutamate kinase [Sediminitomix flava]PWJ39330.1 N-acetylglutamate kinase [Sediminitomix flava]
MKVSVVKIGGNIIDNVEALDTFIQQFAQLEGLKVLVHGGGKSASALMKQMGLEPQMINGRRITDAETLKVVTMMYGGLINKNIVAGLQAQHCNALGLTGADANIIEAHKRPVKEIDFGFVGDVDKVNIAPLKAFFEAGLVPVFCALTHDNQGQLLNTNADTIASQIAVGLSEAYEVSLKYCFEKTGVLMDINDESSLIAHIHQGNYSGLKADGVIADGMIPKLDNAFDAIGEGVAEVQIGKAENLLQKEFIGTSITA